jgi:hypothetical protein
MIRVGARAVVQNAVIVVGIAAACGGGCSPTKPTELVPGVSTQIQVPRDLAGIRIDLLANGAQVFCQTYSAYQGVVTLPSTLGVIAGQSPETIVTVTIGGYDESGVSGSVYSDCTQDQVVDDTKPESPRLLRRSVQTYVAEHILYLPMPLSYSCFDANCAAMGPNFGCKGAQCVADPSNPAAAAQKLVDFTPSLIDGTDICFSPKECFPPSLPDAAWVPAVADASDAANCTYGFGPNAPMGTGLNVRVFYEEQSAESSATGPVVTVLNSGEVEILDEDPVEGFTVLPALPGAGQRARFQLAPGLCTLVQNFIKPPTPPSRFIAITDVQVSPLCPPKTQLLPLCAGQNSPYLPDGGIAPNLPDGASSTDGKCNVAVPLVQTPSTAYLVMDNSEVMHAAFGATGAATAMSLSLADPVFQRTSAAFSFLPHDDAECNATTPTSLATSTIPFQAAASAQPLIAMTLEGWAAPDPPPDPTAHLDLLAAMQIPPNVGAYLAITNRLSLKGQEAPNVAAAMFFLNRVPGGTAVSGPEMNDCTPTDLLGALNQVEGDALAAFNDTPSMQTYFVVLGNDQNDPDVLTFYQQAQADVPQAITTLDGTSADQDTALANFAKVVTRLGTCLYELPTGVTSTNTAIAYDVTTNGVTVPVSVPADPTCTPATQDTATGWNVDSDSRIRICGQPCTDLRNAILASTAAAVAMKQPPPALPVTATIQCGLVDGGAVSDAGDGG